jgi:hypothetical protein
MQTGALCGTRVDNVGEVIKNELVHVQQETKFRVEKLRCATDIHIGREILLSSSLTATIGMEILHLFILDLLGRYSLTTLSSLSPYTDLRETPAAKIFQMKSEEDFRHTMVVTKLFKAATWIFVIILNLSFIFFTMLRGLQRGQDWQVHFTSPSSSSSSCPHGDGYRDCMSSPV